MFNDLHWSIYPGAEKDVLARVAAYAQHCIKHSISAGPALDAERDALPVQVVGTTAIVDLKGLMVRSAGMFARFFGITGSDQIRAAIEAADHDEDIDNIVLRVDSPGGSVSGIAELADAIKATETPIVAHVEGVAASAAFWVASQADRITVGRMDLVGSIGVTLTLFDLSKAFRDDGIETVVIDTGELKTIGAPGTEITKAQRDQLQHLVDFFFDGFVSGVAQGRGLTEKQVRAIADGRMFTPAEAQENGLIDGVSTFDEVMAAFHVKPLRRTSASRARLAI
ncbi:hypothetical protein LCGC14_0424480 [marine sediment metagenome]|uniref:Peptidase S49 domain-containing protein n=1 Tax=marine sediment metagenome TaxID=412755 RepID=A0A0F9VBU8_9ZZZZ